MKTALLILMMLASICTLFSCTPSKKKTDCNKEICKCLSDCECSLECACKKLL
ncbi:hypothetical protein [Rhabdochlamydiaceae symbiont of Dictyostelium giganteum]|uniref:hypothetical protein n=1 Tax=Rhabdochlamydiaceae symbiont of Dictyostelium giganteum TaxID=3342349 RepID=UPI00384D9E9A